MIGRIVKWLVALLALATAGLAGWLAIAPPELIRVGSAYTAKIVCSNVFIAGRDLEEVLQVDVQAPGHWLLGYMKVDVDREAKTATAGLLGLFGKNTSLARDGLGCTNVPDGKLDAVAKVTLPGMPAAAADRLWPEGDRVQPSQDPDIARVLDDAAMTGPGMRAVVVVQNGRIIGERYAEGFEAKTPLLGWSMAKTVNAAVIGTVVKAGKMSLDGKDLTDAWKADGRVAVSIGDLMAMSSGLEFNEDYGDVTDVTRMLFLEPDMAGFAASKPLAGEVGKVFNYSSGTATFLSRLWQDAVGADALPWPQKNLFQPIGMTSALIETDEHGTFVGSSYVYATARDWARFGQFLLQDGKWNGAEILPAGYVAMMREEAPASKGAYTKGQAWLSGPGNEETPAADRDFGVPADTFWLEGHDGQTVAIVPSKQLVVVRMGLTPSKLEYRPQRMLGALVKMIAE
ncbi:MAG TPA: serine hydrolase [Mesorhizobium sp.]|jgi:CubicO group peptidase (beta-lactamase class C family)